MTGSEILSKVGVSMIRSALIVRSPYARQIVCSHKVWELRSRRCHKRETIGIIESGTGTVIGTVRITGCLGPLTDATLAKASSLHRASSASIIQGRRLWAWVLDDAHAFARPVPYHHVNGQQGWVTLTPSVSAAIQHLIEASS